MGFTTGLTAGVTATLGLTYLALLTHERQRAAQGAHLQSQASLLDSLLLSSPYDPAEFPDSYSSEPAVRRLTLAETAKLRWNQEIQAAVRAVQNADWEQVREGLEGAVGRVWANGLSKGQAGIEQAEEKAAPVYREGVRRIESEAGREFDAAKAAATRAAERTLERTREGVRQAREVDLQAKGAEMGDKARDFAHGLKVTEESLVGKAAEKIEGVVEKGIELGKRAAGKAADAAESARNASGAVAGETDVQRALRQRYEKSKETRTVQQLLAERYKRIESVPRDLRGL